MNPELKELIVRLETRTRQLILQQEKLQEEIQKHRDEIKQKVKEKKKTQK